MHEMHQQLDSIMSACTWFRSLDFIRSRLPSSLWQKQKPAVKNHKKGRGSLARMNVKDKRLAQSPSRSGLHSPNTLYGLFTKWIPKIQPAGFWKHSMWNQVNCKMVLKWSRFSSTQQQWDSAVLTRSDESPQRGKTSWRSMQRYI